MAEASERTSGSQAGPGIRQWLFDPFTYIAGGRSLVIGVAAILLAGILGFFSATHFDGVLDVHTGYRAPLGIFLLEGLIDWLSLAVVLLILGKLASKSAFRAIDLFGTQAMARWPMIVVAAAALPPAYQRFMAALPQKMLNLEAGLKVSVAEGAVTAVVMLVSLAAIVWTIALMYRSYSVCCNMRGAKAVGTFVVGILVAEVISKIAWFVVLRLMQ